jgi:ABC-type Fe2+-enterobactin transport system substrate-binding protein
MMLSLVLVLDRIAVHLLYYLLDCCSCTAERRHWQEALAEVGAGAVCCAQLAVSRIVRWACLVTSHFPCPSRCVLVVAGMLCATSAVVCTCSCPQTLITRVCGFVVRCLPCHRLKDGILREKKRQQRGTLPLRYLF